MSNDDTHLYKYGLPVTKSQYDDPFIWDIYRKLYLTATFHFDFIFQIARDIYNDKEIDPELIAQLNSVYKYNETLPERALEYLETWMRNIPGKLTPLEITEFQQFHHLTEKMVSTYLTNTISELYNSPAKIKAYLDSFVVGQEDAKRILCVGFYIHLVRIGKIRSVDLTLQDQLLDNFPKPNILVSGSTGSGKTFIISSLCNLFNIPFIKIDCSSLVSSGYVGHNLNTYLKTLIDKHGLDKAKESIIYFDEFDKISEKNIGRDGSVGGVELQQEFLTLLEDKQIHVLKEKGSDDGYYLNSNNLMLIFSGSFAGIDSIIKKRIQKIENTPSIGFTKKAINKEENLLKKMNFDDLMKFGIIPELVGRIGFIAVLDKLTTDELVTILKQKKSNILEQYHNYFRFNQDQLVIEEDVYELIADEALRRNIGARALQGVIFQLLSDMLFESVNNSSETFVIDKHFFKQRIG